jgi:hypothetical protein
MPDEEEPSFSQIMLMITNQQHQEQMQRQQERDEEREERRARYEDQREERRIQLQMHQESMRQQSQFMTSMMIAIMGGQRTIPAVQPTQGGNSVSLSNDRDNSGSVQTPEEGKTEETIGEI